MTGGTLRVDVDRTLPVPALVSGDVLYLRPDTEEGEAVEYALTCFPLLDPDHVQRCVLEALQFASIAERPDLDDLRATQEIPVVVEAVGAGGPFPGASSPAGALEDILGPVRPLAPWEAARGRSGPPAGDLDLLGPVDDPRSRGAWGRTLIGAGLIASAVIAGAILRVTLPGILDGDASPSSPPAGIVEGATPQPSSSPAITNRSTVDDRAAPRSSPTSTAVPSASPSTDGPQPSASAPPARPSASSTAPSPAPPADPAQPPADEPVDPPADEPVVPVVPTPTVVLPAEPTPTFGGTGGDVAP